MRGCVSRHFTSLMIKDILFLSGSHEQQSDFWEPVTELEESLLSLTRDADRRLSVRRNLSRNAQIGSQLGGSLCPFRSRRKTRWVYSVATAGSENHSSFRTCESACNHLFAQAWTDTNNSVSKMASRTFGEYQKAPPQTVRRFKPQTSQRVDATGNAGEPSGAAP